MSIQSIQARVEAATGALGTQKWHLSGDEYGYVNVQYRKPTSAGDYIPTQVCSHMMRDDADFIAHSRADIPLLLAVAEGAKKWLNWTGDLDDPQASDALDAALSALEAAE